MTMKILDPRVDASGEALRMAPALSSLEGAVVGMIDNAKIGTQQRKTRVIPACTDMLMNRLSTIAVVNPCL